jgi:hypothetical protein
MLFKQYHNPNAYKVSICLIVSASKAVWSGLLPSLFSRSPQCFKICLHGTKFSLFRVTTLTFSDLRGTPWRIVSAHRKSSAYTGQQRHIKLQKYIYAPTGCRTHNLRVGAVEDSTHLGPHVEWGWQITDSTVRSATSTRESQLKTLKVR